MYPALKSGLSKSSAGSFHRNKHPMAFRQSAMGADCQKAGLNIPVKSGFSWRNDIERLHRMYEGKVYVDIDR